jgi:hypothetical protein
MLASRTRSAALRRVSRHVLRLSPAVSSTSTAKYSTESQQTHANTPPPVVLDATKLQGKPRDLTGMTQEDRNLANMRTVFIRPWEPIKDMVEALAILRSIERKYGRIREYRFLRVR